MFCVSFYVVLRFLVMHIIQVMGVCVPKKKIQGGNREKNTEVRKMKTEYFLDSMTKTKKTGDR